MYLNKDQFFRLEDIFKCMDLSIMNANINFYIDKLISVLYVSIKKGFPIKFDFF